ncbi:MAG: helix-turn-helix domain-containing protein [Gemmatimonadetes bacterium]|nr:helix-turn-helix domain-containing protein [Gemmatimonadota bacterium]
MTTLPEGTFYGDERARRHVGGLLLTETAYRPGDVLPRHDHERAYFCCVLRGGFVESDGRESRECDPSTVIFHPPGTAHSDQFGGEPSRCFNVELDPMWLDRIVAEDGELPAGSVVFRRERANWLARHLHDEFRADDLAGGLAVEGLALALLADAARVERAAKGAPPRWVDRAVEILHASATDDVPGLSEIADEVGVHPVHLARVFRRHHGCSLGEYARRLRIDRAREALRDSRLPLGRLAYRLGYADHSHFSRAFRRATGLSPSEYRRRVGSARTDGASIDQDGSPSGR